MVVRGHGSQGFVSITGFSRWGDEVQKTEEKESSEISSSYQTKVGLPAHMSTFIPQPHCFTSKSWPLLIPSAPLAELALSGRHGVEEELRQQ